MDKEKISSKGPIVIQNRHSYDVTAIAGYIYEYCTRNSLQLSPKKLQCLLYFVQAQTLVAEGKSLFGEEIEAWKDGPVVPEIYMMLETVEFTAHVFPKNISIAPLHQKIMDTILKECAECEENYLADLCRKQRPWIMAHRKKSGAVISKQDIFDFFLAK